MKKLSSTLLIIITFIYSSDIQIKAKILDTNNKPLENVNIYYNNQGTASDNNGYFIEFFMCIYFYSFKNKYSQTN